ncbi:hypothetical protein A2400_02015, partial [candidate division WS6 bacterium RIFOXYB1_FULL_33_14]
KQIKSIALGAIPFIAILILWFISIYFKWMPEWFLPSPIKVFKTFVDLLLDGTIFKITVDSVLNLIPPFLLAMIFSLVFGVLIGTSSLMRRIFFPFIATLYPIPSIVWLPFIIILFGFTKEAVWILLFVSSFLKMVYNMISGVRNVNPIWVMVAKNLGLNKVQIVFKVIIPGALPEIITAMRIGFGSIWRSAVAAEMLVSGAGGLGRFIWNAQWAFSFEKIFVGVLLIAIIGLSIEILLFKKIEVLTLEKWGIIEKD